MFIDLVYVLVKRFNIIHTAHNGLIASRSVIEYVALMLPFASVIEMSYSYGKFCVVGNLRDEMKEQLLVVKLKQRPAQKGGRRKV